MVTIRIESPNAINYKATEKKVMELRKQGYKTSQIKADFGFIHSDMDYIQNEFKRMVNRVAFKMDLNGMLKEHLTEQV